MAEATKPTRQDLAQVLEAVGDLSADPDVNGGWLNLPIRMLDNGKGPVRHVTLFFDGQVAMQLFDSLSYLISEYARQTRDDVANTYQAASLARRADVTKVYTIVIEASGDDGCIWQALQPAEYVTVSADDRYLNDAADLARNTADHQTVAVGGLWRVRVWEGDQADTGTAPAAEFYSR